MLTHKHIALPPFESEPIHRQSHFLISLESLVSFIQDTRSVSDPARLSTFLALKRQSPIPYSALDSLFEATTYFQTHTRDLDPLLVNPRFQACLSFFHISTPSAPTLIEKSILIARIVDLATLGHQAFVLSSSTLSPSHPDRMQALETLQKLHSEDPAWVNDTLSLFAPQLDLKTTEAAILMHRQQNLQAFLARVLDQIQPDSADALLPPIPLFIPKASDFTPESLALIAELSHLSPTPAQDPASQYLQIFSQLVKLRLTPDLILSFIPKGPHGASLDTLISTLHPHMNPPMETLLASFRTLKASLLIHTPGLKEIHFISAEKRLGDLAVFLSELPLLTPNQYTIISEFLKEQQDALAATCPTRWELQLFTAIDELSMSLKLSEDPSLSRHMRHWFKDRIPMALQLIGVPPESAYNVHLINAVFKLSLEHLHAAVPAHFIDPYQAPHLDKVLSNKPLLISLLFRPEDLLSTLFGSSHLTASEIISQCYETGFVSAASAPSVPVAAKSSFYAYLAQVNPYALTQSRIEDLQSACVAEGNPLQLLRTCLPGKLPFCHWLFQTYPKLVITLMENLTAFELRLRIFSTIDIDGNSIATQLASRYPDDFLRLIAGFTDAQKLAICEFFDQDIQSVVHLLAAKHPSHLIKLIESLSAFESQLALFHLENGSGIPLFQYITQHWPPLVRRLLALFTPPPPPLDRGLSA